MIKVLVTGANGQLGSLLRLISGEYDGFSIDYTDIDELNICDPEAIHHYFDLQKPRYIINCAAYTQVDKAESEPDAAYLLNAEAVKNIADSASGIGARIIHISTDYVFNGKNSRPYNEKDETDPESVYGMSKLKGEQYLLNNPDALIIRTSWLYSQFGKNFVKTIIRNGREKDILKVVADQAGSPTYAPDLARAILQIIRFTEASGRPFLSSIYHYSNLGETNWFEFAVEIIKEADINCTVLPIQTGEFPVLAPRPSYSVLDNTKIMTTFKLDIPFWKDSLKFCIAQLN